MRKLIFPSFPSYLNGQDLEVIVKAPMINNITQPSHRPLARLTKTETGVFSLTMMDPQDHETS